MAQIKNGNPNVAELVEPYQGQWVALTRDQRKVVGHSRNLRTAVNQANKNGVNTPHVVKSPYWLS